MVLIALLEKLKIVRTDVLAMSLLSPQERPLRGHFVLVCNIGRC